MKITFKELPSKKSVLLLCVLGAVLIFSSLLYLKIDPYAALRIGKTCKTYHRQSKDIKVCNSDFLGLTEEEAVEKAKKLSFGVHILSRDGVSQGINSNWTNFDFKIVDNRVDEVIFNEPLQH